MAKGDVVGKHVAGGKLDTEAVGKIADVRTSFVEGNVSPNTADDLFAKDFYDKQYTQRMIDVDRHSPGKGTIDTAMLPRYAKMGVDYK